MTVGIMSSWHHATVWEDLESIRAFAGERWQEAVITRGAPPQSHLN
jgi:hypothetical protein